MKKLQIFVCVLLMLCLAACGNTDGGITTGTSADTKPEVTTEKTKNVSETTESGEPFSPDQPVVDAFSYADLADLTFTFSSGVGGWQTTMYIQADGSFTGEYFGSWLGETGEGYPDGTTYVCTFSGKFAPLSQLDDLTYTTAVESISYAQSADTEEIRDGMRYVYTTAYGLDDAKTLYFYLPGTKTADLSEACMSWVSTYLWAGNEDEHAEVLPFVVLFNENAGTAFAGEVEG